MEMFKMRLKRLMASFLFVLVVPALADNKSNLEERELLLGKVEHIMISLAKQSGENYQNNRHISILEDEHWLKPLSNRVAYNIDKGLAPLCELEEQAKEILSETNDRDDISYIQKFFAYAERNKNEIMETIYTNTALIYERCSSLASLLTTEKEEKTEDSTELFIAYGIHAECPDFDT